MSRKEHKAKFEDTLYIALVHPGDDNQFHMVGKSVMDVYAQVNDIGKSLQIAEYKLDSVKTYKTKLKEVK